MGYCLFSHSIHKYVREFVMYSKINRYVLIHLSVASFGTKLMENLESKNKYMNKIDEIMNIYISRIQVFLFHSNFMYSFSSLKKREDECIETMSNITNTVSIFIIHRLQR